MKYLKPYYAEGLELDDLYGPIQPKPFYDPLYAFSKKGLYGSEGQGNPCVYISIDKYRHSFQQYQRISCRNCLNTKQEAGVTSLGKLMPFCLKWRAKHRLLQAKGPCYLQAGQVLAYFLLETSKTVYAGEIIPSCCQTSQSVNKTSPKCMHLCRGWWQR